MPTTTIIVQHASGAPAVGAKVVLSFDFGGVTRPVLTGRSGEAVIDHSATGTAKVIINGSTRGTIRTPTRTSFKL